MTPRTMVRWTVTLFLSFVFIGTIANATPLEHRRNGLALPLAVQNTTTTSSFGAKKATVGANSSSLNTSSDAARTRTTSSDASHTTTTSSDASHTTTTSSDASHTTKEARIAAAASTPSGTLGTFCRAFVKQCYLSALEQQTAEVAVAHSCQRIGNKFSTSFKYSCEQNGKVITAKVLKALGKEYHAPLTTYVEKEVTVTLTLPDVVTTTRTSRKVTTATATTTTTTKWNEEVRLITRTVPAATQTLTTTIPYTVSVTTRPTLTVVSTSTSFTATVTVTDAFLGDGEIPVYEVEISEDEAVGMQRRAPSTFCLAYKIACEGECARVSSRVKTNLCQSNLPRYTLACICKNGRRETQHALEAVAEDRKIVSITSLGTKTAYVTSPQTTTTLWTEALSTELLTMTSTADETSTRTITSTLRTGLSFRYTGSSFPVTTEVSSIPITTTTITTTTNAQITTTTQLVYPTTGFVRGFDAVTGEDVGILRRRAGQSVIVLSNEDDRTPVPLMAVRDTPTGLYKLAILGVPDVALVGYNPSQMIFEEGASSYVFLNYAETSPCGAAGSAPGPISSTSNPCEVFIFSPLALDPSPGETSGSVEIRPYWYNPTSSSPPTYIATWATLYSSLVALVADLDAFAAKFPATTPVGVTLRFPFDV